MSIKIELPKRSAPTDFADNATVVENILFSNIVLDQVERAPIHVIVHPDNLYGKLQIGI